MVKNIVEMHQGTISFKTETDVGTSFEVSLPKEN